VGKSLPLPRTDAGAQKAELFLDATLTSLFVKPAPGKPDSSSERAKKVAEPETVTVRMPRDDFGQTETVAQSDVATHAAMPEARTGRWWNPRLYQWCGLTLRVFGFIYLAIVLLRLETPSFATFLIVKGLLAMFAFTRNMGAIVLPLAGTALGKFCRTT
jgi:hypothetical protein